VGVACDALADASAEQPLEKAGLACTHDDQIGLVLLGSFDELLRRRPGYAGKFDGQVSVAEDRPHSLSMLLPELLVPLDDLTWLCRWICGVGHQPERSGRADICKRLWRGDADDYHPGCEGARVLGCAT
jgi:hypothetical protein